MVRLGRQDAGRGVEIGLARDQLRRAAIGGDADVGQQVRADQEADVVGERIEDVGRAEDAGGRVQVGVVADERRRALIGGHAHVLENEGAKQEVVG